MGRIGIGEGTGPFLYWTRLAGGVLLIWAGLIWSDRAKKWGLSPAANVIWRKIPSRSTQRSNKVTRWPERHNPKMANSSLPGPEESFRNLDRQDRYETWGSPGMPSRKVRTSHRGAVVIRSVALGLPIWTPRSTLSNNDIFSLRQHDDLSFFKTQESFHDTAWIHIEHGSLLIDGEPNRKDPLTWLSSKPVAEHVHSI